MLQILQNLDTGKTEVADVPSPAPKNKHVIISTSKSLISVGTERMLVNFGKSNLVQKALSQPERVKEVLQKAKTDGILSTIDAVRSKLDQPLPLGYSNVGVVKDSGNTSFDVGTRVVSNGSHAEIVRVPKNLVAKIPDEVDDESASFTIIGSIALQGIRLLNPTLGETFVVTGLGLIGLLSVQILIANGCKVIAIDYDKKKCNLAKNFGAEVINLSLDENPIDTAISFTKGVGVDGVLITASSSSNNIIQESARMCRKKGRIILVGVVGLNINRADFYEKELTFQVSCSYGPGRYDKEYEDFGNDYPIGYVRWTEQRNFEAVLSLIAKGLIDVKPLIDSEHEISEASEAYKKIDDNNSLGILINYPSKRSQKISGSSVKLKKLKDDTEGHPGNRNISFIGGGNYASRVLIPAFYKANASFSTIVTSGGINSYHHGKKNKFTLASTDINDALEDNSGSVVIATQHYLHAKQVVQSLNAGKNIFVEKPLALNISDVDEIEKAQKKSNKILMVGFNRRFSPHIKKIKSLLNSKPMPKCFVMTMNAGEIDKDHWTQDKNTGGGRIIGEACHYIDLMCFLSDSSVSSFSANKILDNQYMQVSEDKAIINLAFADGSIGVINYFANGGKSFPKERVEVFCDNAVLQLDNFKNLKGYGWKGFKNFKTWSQDKGQRNCVKAFMDAVEEGSKPPISHDEIFDNARLSIKIAESLKN